ncbi:MAG: aminodeoxychorismate/anthranilate synthase component II [Rickettsiales bacterium]
MILIIDNYDSFTYNLDNYLKRLLQKTLVVYNDKITIDEIKSLNVNAILTSPGPFGPKEAKLSTEVVGYCMDNNVPLLGVCLGMQAMAYYTGAKIIKNPYPMHGKISKIENNGKNLFKGLPKEFNVTRYHSLSIEEGTLHKDFEIDARSKDDNLIMAISHKTKPLFGLQYHPESICSEYGLEQLEKFISLQNQRS